MILILSGTRSWQGQCVCHRLDSMGSWWPLCPYPQVFKSIQGARRRAVSTPPPAPALVGFLSSPPCPPKPPLLPTVRKQKPLYASGCKERLMAKKEALLWPSSQLSSCKHPMVKATGRSLWPSLTLDQGHSSWVALALIPQAHIQYFSAFQLPDKSLKSNSVLWGWMPCHKVAMKTHQSEGDVNVPSWEEILC